MSNFICPTCGFTNIDCGKAGYKTDREIVLEKKLEIAVSVLEEYADARTWDCCHRNQCAYVNGFEAALALAQIKEIK